MKTKIKIGLILLTFLVVLLSYEKGYIFSSESCCHVNAQQLPEEEGNPTHERPENACATVAKDKQVPCKCHQARKCDGTEPRSCKSWCFKDMCLCADPCV